MKSKYSKPRVLFEMAKGMATGKEPDIGEEFDMDGSELGRTRSA